MSRITAAALALTLGLGIACAAAQPPVAETPVNGRDASTVETPPAVSEAAGPSPLARESSDATGPDIFLLPDSTGKLRQLLGYRYEDFFKAWRAEQSAQQAAQCPPFSMTKFSATAVAATDAVDVAAVVDVEIHATGWVEVPLHMGSLIVSRWDIAGGGERDFLRFDSERNGFSAWLYCKQGDRRSITLAGKLIVQRDDDQRRIEIDLPPAAISQFDVTAPRQVEIESPQLSLASTETADDGRYTSRIEGAKGRLALRWGPRETSELDGSTMLAATVDTIIGVEPGRLTYEAFITLSDYGRQLDRIRIRLPRGATAATVPAGAGYEAIPIASDAGRRGSSLVEVRFDAPDDKPPVIRLLAEQVATAEDQGLPLTATPFEAAGAFRQRGHVAVRVSETLHADFQREGRIEQIDPQELPERLRVEPPLAAFASAGGQWQLRINTQPRERKAQVTPNYALRLGAQGAALDVELDYQMLGKRLFELRVDLRGWELSEQPIESGGAVDLAEQHVTSNHILILPLNDSELQQARVRFTLRREAGLGLHKFPLPESLDAFSLPGSLSVGCEEAWRAVVQLEDSTGVTTTEPNDARIVADVDQANGSSMQTSRRDATIRRLQTFLPRPSLTVDVSQREQEITVESLVDVRFRNETLEVEQRLQYEIAYQPTSELSAAVDADLLANQGLELLLDGKPLSSTAVEILPLAPGPSGDADSADNLRLLVHFPRPTAGRVALHIRSVHPLTSSQLTSEAKIVVPLAVPSQPADSTAVVSAASTDRRPVLWTDGGNDLWMEIAGESESADVADQRSASFSAIAVKPVSELALRLEEPSANRSQDVRIEAVWAQTWAGGMRRQDRFVYRFRTEASQIELSLPPDYEGQPIETILDGQVVVAEMKGGQMTVELPTVDGLSEHTLELRRQAPQQLAPSGGIGARFPLLVGAERSGPLFWQLVLPREVAVVSVPDGMNAEYQLDWRDFGWGRQPTQSQADLERWCRATAAPPLPASSNQYLFSAFDAPPQAAVKIVRRAWLIVAAAVAALGVGLACLYTNIGRSAGFWWAVVVVASAALLAYPELAVLMVQAICLGGALTLVSAATKWLLADGRPPATVRPAPASSIASLTATQSWDAGAEERSIIAIGSDSSNQPSESAP